MTRKTSCWPLRIFYGMLDQANVNACILYNLNANDNLMARDKFILKLGEDLIKPFMQLRLAKPTLRTSLRLQIEEYFKSEELSDREDPVNLLTDNKMSNQKRCSFCPTNLDRKSFYFFSLRCRRCMCKSYTVKLCTEC